MDSYLMMMQQIHVLLVDHDSECLDTARLLETCQYKVTPVELASVAITMLLSAKVKFDIVMANINSPDLHGFELLQLAVSMEIPTILMSVDDNTFMATKAIESGAFLCIKKPATMEMLRCLWQHVIREKTWIISKRDKLVVNYIVRGVEFREVICHADDNPNNIGGINMGKRKSTERIRVGKASNGEEEYDSENCKMISKKMKRKVCTEWTQELHKKFMDAIEKLGEGRCFPKDILELMNVPGLTRMQVASHLQKCRNDNWGSSQERKSSLPIQPVSSNNWGSQHKQRRFGSMPLLGKDPSYHVQENSTTEQGSKTYSKTEMRFDETGTGPIITNTSHHQRYGSVDATPITNSSNTKHDYFGFPEIDNLFQNFSSLPQGPDGGKDS